MKLYSFFRSGTSYRLRIALNLKGLDYDYIPVNLRTGEHKGENYKTLNPQGLVPSLETDRGVVIQSPAIIEYLEERWPTPALLPGDMDDRAYVRSMAAIIGCDIHPINNLRILQELKGTFGASEEQVNSWCDKWISTGFDAIEAMLGKDSKRNPGFCFGDGPGLVECYLIPQVHSAMRFGVDLDKWPLIMAVYNNCTPLPAFAKAAPECQVDTV